MGSLVVTREEVYEALWDLHQQVTWDPTIDAPFYTTWTSSQRRVVLFSDVPSEQQPFVCQAEHGETIAQRSNLPYKRIYEASWIVYQSSALDPTVAGGILNNKILDAIQVALEPPTVDPGYPNRNTLGGLVYHCYVDGVILKVPGDLDGQAMMVVPVKMLVP